MDYVALSNLCKALLNIYQKGNSDDIVCFKEILLCCGIFLQKKNVVQIALNCGADVNAPLPEYVIEIFQGFGCLQTTVIHKEEDITSVLDIDRISLNI